MNRIVLFEDTHVHKLTPLIHMRPAFDLLCGTRQLFEKIVSAYPESTQAYWVRDALCTLVSKQKSGAWVNTKMAEPALFVNGRVLWDEDLAKTIPWEGEDCIYTKEDTLVAARLSAEECAKLLPGELLTVEQLSHLPRKEIQCNEARYFWDLIHENPIQIEKDVKVMGYEGRKEGVIHSGAYLINEKRITVMQDAVILPSVVLDATNGDIVIEEGSKILPHTYVEGPCYIGKGTLVKTGTSIFHGCSFGEVCKVGGEVDASIMLSFSNKQHVGFLGHAYVGQWVNIGADTNNSDLKNDYGPVKCIIHDELINTHSQFVGMAMGDFSRTGINTMFNTGTIVGVGCNIFGTGFPPKVIPSFTWGGAEAMVDYRLDKFMETARRMLKRRFKELTAEEEAILVHIHQNTENDRERARIMNRMKTN